MKILSVNTGSSSLKFKMYEMPKEEVLIYGYIEKIGSNSSYKIITTEVKEYKKGIKDFNEAVKILLVSLFENKIISQLDEIKAIGHRIVNGKDYYHSEVVTTQTIKRLENIKYLSKVHMQGHIAGIKAFKKLMPKIPQILHYDTAFHHTIPIQNYLYSVPYQWYKKYGVRKYGFHGISCEYITKKMEKILHKKVNLIICHIGYGSSVTSVINSKSYDNSMGFTANEGLMMGTRCGNIDYTILPYMHKISGYSLEQLDNILNYESGLEGMVKGASDNRDLEKYLAKKDKKAIVANEMYENRVVDYIAKYYVRMKNIDAIVFCGGVGENSVNFRKNIINKLQKLNLVIDEEKNKTITKFSSTPTGIISKPSSSIPCYVVPTDEELMIAKKTYTFIK